MQEIVRIAPVQTVLRLRNQRANLLAMQPQDRDDYERPTQPSAGDHSAEQLVVGWPGLLNDAGAVAQRDLGAGPALDRSREGRARQPEVVYAGQMLVKVRTRRIVPAVDTVRVVLH